MTRVLVVDDSGIDSRVVEELLKGSREPFQITKAQHLQEAIGLLGKFPFDVILLDLNLPDSEGLNTVLQIQYAAVNIPIVVLTGLGDEALAMQAVRRGASDYLVKGEINAKLLQKSLRYAVERQKSITERKKIEKLKDELISVVAHEMRVPLTSIRGSLQYIAGHMAEGLPPKTLELIKIASRASERLVRLINDLLDMDRIESGQMTFDLKPLDVTHLLEQAIQTNLVYAELFGVKLVLERTVPDTLVHVDPDRFMQIMTNLLSNAIKFSQQDDTVTIDADQIPSAIRISITDHGPGIPEAFRDQMFEKFSQADSHKGGTGLGLSITKALVERLGGQIGYTTGETPGTTFYFDLPVGS